jgi:hypothetical protein
MSLREEHFFLHAEQRKSRLERKKKGFGAFFTHSGLSSEVTFYCSCTEPVVPYRGTALNRFMPIFITYPFFFVAGL